MHRQIGMDVTLRKKVTQNHEISLVELAHTLLFFIVVLVC